MWSAFSQRRFEIPNDQAVVVKVCRYFENNQHRMKYNEYLAAGYPIATGVIEHGVFMSKNHPHCNVDYF